MTRWHSSLPLAATALAWALSGCTGPQTISARPPSPVDQADRIVIECTSVAVNWDNRPGPDGLPVRVHVFRQAGKLPVTVKGRLEFVLYEGLVSPDETAKAKPFRSWRLEGEQLRSCLGRSPYGWGYVVPLAWGAAAPRTAWVTLLARYVPRKGAPISADLMNIPMGSQ